MHRLCLVSLVLLAGCGLSEEDRRALKPEKIDYEKLAKAVKDVPVHVNVDVDYEKIKQAIQEGRQQAPETTISESRAVVHLDARTGVNGPSERLKRDLYRMAEDARLGWTVGWQDSCDWVLVSEEPGDTPLPYVEFFKDGELKHTSFGYTGLAAAGGYEGPVGELTKWHPKVAPRKAVRRAGSVEYLNQQSQTAPVFTPAWSWETRRFRTSFVPQFTCVNGVCYQNW